MGKEIDMETTLTTKGQITLPKGMRDAMHLKSGDKIVFEEIGDNQYVLRPKMLDVRTLKGIASYEGKPKTLEEMEAAIHENSRLK